MKIVLDPGHGGTDPGALGKMTKEKDIVLRIAQLLSKKLLQSAHPIQPILTRDKDLFVTLADRVRVAKENGADLFLSLHCNSCDEPGPKGHEVYMAEEHSKKSEELASNLYGEISHIARWEGRGIRTADYFVIRNTPMPAVLVELDFINNPDAEAMLNDGKYENSVCDALRQGIENTWTWEA